VTDTDDDTGTGNKRTPTRRAASGASRASGSGGSRPRPRKKADSTQASKRSDTSDRSSGSAEATGSRMRARDVARRAAEELVDLLGMQPEAVTGLERRDGEWLVDLDVVEVARIPDTTSIIAAYEVRLDEQGDLLGYRRTGRHVRGRTEDR
jgi:hypothetical protein